MNKYLIHIQNNLTFFLWNLVYIYGIYTLLSIFIYKSGLNFNPLILSLSILMTLAMVLYQTRYSFNKDENFNIEKYKLKNDEKEIYRDFCNAFKYSNVAGDLILTNKRIIFIPKAEFNNFYFDVNLSDIKEFNQDSTKQPILILKDGSGYTLKIKNRFKYISEYNNMNKSYWNE